ncbi:MAG TPA: L,D-transpeptidase family protein [Stellaceae bacterium]|nr:L,D-transpeptidase family protein [Stellaceae bacterium]
MLFRGWRRRRGIGCRLSGAVALCTLAAVPAAAAEFSVAPGQNVVGGLQRYVVKAGDVFPDIARRFDVGYTALVAANPGVDPWGPGVGRAMTIPSVYVLPDAPYRGVVINLGQWRLFYFPPGGDRVLTFPIGIGVIGWKTPLGTSRVVRKEANPAWYPPPSVRAEHRAEGDDLPAVVPAGPDNPLGAFALYLGWPRYLVHGTNKPDGVGRNVSHGCIRLYPDDIEKLFAAVPIGTPVRVVNQPATAGWAGDRLYVQIHPSQAQADEIDTEQRVTPDPAQGVRPLVMAAAGTSADALDWDAVEKAARARIGIPVKVAERSAYAAAAPAAAPTYARGDTAPSTEARSGYSYDPRLPERFDHLLQSLTRADRTDDRDAEEPYVQPPQDPNRRTATDPFRRGAGR